MATEILTSRVVGEGSADAVLTPTTMSNIVTEALEVIESGERVLAIIPDKTRDDNTDFLFPLAAKLLSERRVGLFDVLVAQGTHPPMATAQKLAKLGLESFSGTLFDHRWDSADDLITLGELSAGQVANLTSGLLNDSVAVSLNKLLAPGAYDTIILFGATVPHEVAGFAGGAKYFFPGVAGPELTHMTHWLGALAGIENIIGNVETPTRRLIEAAADLVPARVISLNTVVTRNQEGELLTFALFAGDVREAFRKAAEVSSRIHIRYTGRKYKRVVAVLDSHYDEMWVGGKASYKLGAILEDGGELIIYAPHLTRLSDTHGALIEKYGYAPLESVRDMLGVSKELRENLCIAAHLAHVAYAGRVDASGNIVTRYQITMGTGIDAETCKRVKLGYVDYRNLPWDDLRKDQNTLIVENAGRDLYKVAPQ